MSHVRRPMVLALALAVLASAAAAGPADEGKAHLAARRWPEAAASFEKAMTGATPPKEVLKGFAQAVVEGRLVDRYEKAQNALLAALKGADDRELRLALARVFLVRGDQDNRWHGDAEVQFKKVLAANPDDEEAVVGVAQMFYARADAQRGLEALDALLAKNPKAAKALRWKGELLYDEAVQAYKAAGKLDDASKALFGKAHGAFEAATAADPTSFDAWLKRGYAAQYLGKVDDAVLSYEKAIAIDGDSRLPLDALARTLGGGKFEPKLAELAKTNPKASMIQYFQAYALFQAGKRDDAEKAIRAHLAVAPRKVDGHLLLAQILESQADPDGAAKAYRAVLEENPDHYAAAGALDQRMFERAKAVADDPAKLRPVVAEYKEFLAAAPRYVNGRNNLGFLLRDAFGPSGQRSGPSHPRWILDESVKQYEEAAALIGEWNEAHERTYAYPLRHSYGQILNDAGLMFQYYPEVQDLAKAEALYRRAQDWTQHGYWDAYGNLMRILKEKERWKDALEYAEACAEGLKDESGAPNETYRATAAGEAAQLRRRVEKE